MTTAYAPPHQLQGDRIRLEAAEARHLAIVLRLREGDLVRVLDGCGACHVGAWDPDSGSVRIREQIRMEPWRCRVRLGAALLKGERWDWMLQKAVEIGVQQVVPVLARHAVVRWEPAGAGRKLERWRRIAVSALKQSGQGWLPVIDAPAPVETFCAGEQPGARWILSERGGRHLGSVLESGPQEISLLAGPEGGWSDAEAASAVAAGYTPVTLGRRILRAETAALYALSVIRHVTES